MRTRVVLAACAIFLWFLFVGRDSVSVDAGGAAGESGGRRCGRTAPAAPAAGNGHREKLVGRLSQVVAHVVVQPLGLALIPCAHYSALPKNFEARQGRGIEASDEKLVARAGNAATHSHLVGMEYRRIRRTLALANGTLVIFFSVYTPLLMAFG